MFKIVCLFGFLFGHFQTTIGISVVLLRCKSARCIIRAQGCCALTIGISAVVYFFAETGNFPVSTTINLNLFSGCIKKDKYQLADTIR